MPTPKKIKGASSGIEPLKKSIRIWWRIEGELCRETIAIAPTLDGLERATQLAALIKLELDIGTFDLLRHFPNSRRQEATKFEEFIRRYLNAVKPRIAPSSFKSYEGRIRTHISARWGEYLPQDITGDAVEQWVEQVLYQKLHPKTVREILSLFNAIWQRVEQKTQRPNPANIIRLPYYDRDDIDPFTLSEINAILKSESDPIFNDMWIMLFWSGLSYHEWHALAIDDIDLDKGLITVQRSHVKGHYRVTKTRRRKRTVQMLTQVKAAIARQLERPHIVNQSLQTIDVLSRDNRTYKKYQVKWLWRDPRHDTHYIHDYIYRHFTAAQKRAGVRHRGPNNGRHTYASQLISSGQVPLAWIADQLGHESTRMLNEHYGRWIKEDGPDLIHRLDDYFSTDKK